MAISKVEIKNSDGTKNVLVDLTGDTVSANTLTEGITAHGADGEEITGTLHKTTGIIYTADSVEFKDWSSSPDVIRFNKAIAEDIIFKTGGSGLTIDANASEFGDATAEYVISGKTFTSESGLKVSGSLYQVTGGWSYTEQVSASEITRDGSRYVESSAKIDTPRAFAKDSYVRVAIPLTQFGDATPEDVAKGKIFTSADGFKATGTAEATISDDNCEAYQITSASTALNFKRTDGTLKVWGYGYKSVSTYQKTVYAFCGDGYYTGTSYGTPTKTDVTWELNSDGTLNFPIDLDALDLIVTKGV